MVPIADRKQSNSVNNTQRSLLWTFTLESEESVSRGPLNSNKTVLWAKRRSFSLLDSWTGRSSIQSGAHSDHAFASHFDDHDCRRSSHRIGLERLRVDQSLTEIRNDYSARWFPEEKVRCVVCRPSKDVHRQFVLSFRKLKDVLISLSEQVVKRTREELEKHDKAQIIVDNEPSIKEAIKSIGDQHVIEHAVFKLLCEKRLRFLLDERNNIKTSCRSSFLDSVQRYVNFVHQWFDQATAGSTTSNVAIPNGLNIVMNEVTSTVSFFLRLITYNKMVFHEHYDRIIGQLETNSTWTSSRSFVVLFHFVWLLFIKVVFESHSLVLEFKDQSKERERERSRSLVPRSFKNIWPR